ENLSVRRITKARILDIYTLHATEHARAGRRQGEIRSAFTSRRDETKLASRRQTAKKMDRWRTAVANTSSNLRRLLNVQARSEHPFVSDDRIRSGSTKRMLTVGVTHDRRRERSTIRVDDVDTRRRNVIQTGDSHVHRFNATGIPNDRNCLRRHARPER